MGNRLADFISKRVGIIICRVDWHTLWGVVRSAPVSWRTLAKKRYLYGNGLSTSRGGLGCIFAAFQAGTIGRFGLAVFTAGDDTGANDFGFAPGHGSDHDRGARRAS